MKMSHSRKNSSGTRPPQKHYIREYGDGPHSGPGDASVILLMIILAAGIGFLSGAFVWTVLCSANLLTHLVWGSLEKTLDVPWLPVAVCTAGGAAIAAWTKLTGFRIDSLTEILAVVRTTGEYHLKSVWKSFVSFLLPLVFGGSIGPEAGLSGFAAGACTWIGNRLRHAGLKTRVMADVSAAAVMTAVFGAPLYGIAAAAEESLPNEKDYTFRRPVKLVLYTVSAAAAFGGAALIASIPAFSGGMPRFDTIHARGTEYLAILPLACAGWGLAILFHLSDSLCGRITEKLGDKAGYLPILCGLILGTAAVFFPDVLFPGEEQSAELIRRWTAVPAIVLFLTGIIKVAATPMCIRFGWRGGNFFPVIFSGISFGYGIASVTGLDPVLCVLPVTAAVLAGMTRKPLITIALLFLCFPLRNAPAMIAAALIGAYLPMPKFRPAGDQSA